jgi:glucose-6-phosphate isomerase
MIHMQIDISKAVSFSSPEGMKQNEKKLASLHKVLVNGTGKGNDFLGWIKLPAGTDPAILRRIKVDAGKRLTGINHMAEMGTLLAHVDGGVPNIRISVAELNEETLRELIYFFEFACALSGYLLGVNPFDQPGVEAYKKNMFALIGKPGFEEEGKKLRERLL